MDAALYIDWARLCWGWSPPVIHEAPLATFSAAASSWKLLRFSIELTVAGDGLQHLTMKLRWENCVNSYWCCCHICKLPCILIMLANVRIVLRILPCIPEYRPSLSLPWIFPSISPCSSAHWLSSLLPGMVLNIDHAALLYIEWVLHCTIATTKTINLSYIVASVLQPLRENWLPRSNYIRWA